MGRLPDVTREDGHLLPLPPLPQPGRLPAPPRGAGLRTPTPEQGAGVVIFLIDPVLPDPAPAVTALVADLSRQLPLGRPALLGRLPQVLPGGRLHVPLLGEIPESC